MDHVQRSVSSRGGNGLQRLALALWAAADVGPVAFAVDSSFPTLGPVPFPRVDIQYMSRVQISR